jgi:hypothetical protein
MPFVLQRALCNPRVPIAWIAQTKKLFLILVAFFIPKLDLGFLFPVKFQRHKEKGLCFLQILRDQFINDTIPFTKPWHCTSLLQVTGS